MFVLGLLLGILLTLVIGFWLLLQIGAAPASGYSRADIADIERRTIHSLIAESLAAEQCQTGEVVEGAAIEVRRS